MNERKTFSRIAVVEATSWLLLLAATVVKHVGDQPIGVEILGPIHGVLFLAYAMLALMMAIKYEIGVGRALLVLVVGMVPTGGYFIDRWVERWIDEAEPATSAA